MGMTHNDEAERVFVVQQLRGPLGLPVGSAGQLLLVDGVISQERAERIHQPEPQIGVQHSIDCRSRWMMNQSVNHSGLPARFGQTVTMNRSNSAATDVKGRSGRFEPESDLLLPEVGIPSIVVAANHHDGDLPAQMGECSGDLESPTRDHSRVGKPEVEQVAVDEKAIAEVRHCLEELQEGRFDSWRGHPQVGIRDYNKAVAEHGAKDGAALRTWQPRARAASLSRVASGHPKRLPR